MVPAEHIHHTTSNIAKDYVQCLVKEKFQQRSPPGKNRNAGLVQYVNFLKSEGVEGRGGGCWRGRRDGVMVMVMMVRVKGLAPFL